MMRGFLLVILIFSLSILTGIQPLRAQAVVKGKISSAKTGKPLVGAHIFLSSTKIGTATNAAGQYRLQNIPPGSYRLVVTMIGFKKTTKDIVIGPTDTVERDFKMEPVIYELPEIFVGNLDKKWRRNLSRFIDLFIGESESADSVRILNPEVLRFEKKWWGKLRAEALAPLKIENRALGYHITYYLDEFEHSGTRTRWNGEPLFRELEPADSSQMLYWKKNRRKAFNGSLQHFLLALLQDRVKEEGFRIENIRQGISGYSSRNSFRITANRLIDESDEDYLHHLKFFGRLKIIYLHETQGWRYVRWSRDPQRGSRRAQTSYLELNERPVTVDSNGEIIQPYGATQFGFFAFQRLSDLTPREYRPEGYHILQ